MLFVRGAGQIVIAQPNYGFGPACEQGAKFVVKPECRNGDAPSILVWGDSYAMHLVPGLAATTVVQQATRSVCGPTLGLAAFEPGSKHGNTERRAKDCITFNDSVIVYVAQSPAIRTVVLSSAFGYYINEKFRLVVEQPGSILDASAGVDALADSMYRTIQALRVLGKAVVLVAPPPSAGFNVGACLERIATGKVVAGELANCAIPRAMHEVSNAAVLSALSRIQARSDAIVINFEPFLCDASVCRTSLAGVPLYADAGHLTQQGAVYLAKYMEWHRVIGGLSR